MISDSPTVRSHYLSAMYDDRMPSIVHKMAVLVRWIRINHERFDSLAFTGMSGAAIAFPLTLITDIPLTCVRKDHDGSHYQRRGGGSVEGHVQKGLRYLIVDDQVSSGRTIRHIMHAIAREVPGSRCVGIARYYPNDYTADRKDFNGWPMWHTEAKDWDRVLRCMVIPAITPQALAPGLLAALAAPRIDTGSPPQD